ncbi:MAG: hypothetical protein AB1630_03935 [bacterium]
MSVGSFMVKEPVVLLSLKDYQKIQGYIEELEDNLALYEEKKKNPKFRPYSEFREELIKEGLLQPL